MTNNYNANTIERTVQATLERLGVTSGFITFNKAKKIYGNWFTELVKLGEIRPILKGEGKNGTQRYLVSDILEKIDEAKRQAYDEMFNN